MDRARLAVGVDPKEISAQRGWYVKPRSGSLPSLLGGFLSSIFASFLVRWRSRRGFSTPFLGGFRARSSADFYLCFAPVFDRHFHGSFSVGHCPGNCLFHWVFWELAPFFEDS